MCSDLGTIFNFSTQELWWTQEEAQMVDTKTEEETQMIDGKPVVYALLEIHENEKE